MANIVAPDAQQALATLHEEHPRLILTAQRIVELQAIVKNDPVAQGYFKQLTAQGTAMLKQPPVAHVLIGPRLLDKSRTALDRITTLALLYQLDGNQQWADRAILEMRTVAAFPDWNPSHFLDVAEMTTALAFGYDWLYDALTPEDRTTIKTAIVEKGLRAALPEYHNQKWWSACSHNWNNVCNGGMIIGALAIADEEPELAGGILHSALAGLPKALVTYAPDGAWPEGPAYWEYATKYTLLAASALKTALDTDFGIMAEPGLRVTGYFPLALTGPTNAAFNFADAGTGINPRPWLYGLATCYNDAAYAYLARVGQADKKAMPFDLIWYKSNGTAADVAKLPRDFRFNRIQVVTLRSAWNDPNAIFVGVKAGDNRANHSHLDLGSFILDADGVRWADDLGSDDYNLPGYFGDQRWTYYRLRTEGHNTLVLNGLNQDDKASAVITKSRSNDDGAFAITDLTAAYAPAGATSIHRGVLLFNQRHNIIVQDEITTKAPADIAWALHTRATITIDATGTQATLSLQGKILHARLLSPTGAVFTAVPVTIAPPQHPIKGENNLLVHLPQKTTSTCIAVLFTPGTQEEPNQVVSPLDNWK